MMKILSFLLLLTYLVTTGFGQNTAHENVNRVAGEFYLPGPHTTFLLPTNMGVA